MALKINDFDFPKTEACQLNCDNKATINISKKRSIMIAENMLKWTVTF